MSYVREKTGISCCRWLFDLWDHPGNTAELHTIRIWLCVFVYTFNCKWSTDTTKDTDSGQLPSQQWLRNGLNTVLTFEFVVLRVSGEKAVGEELGKGEARVLWPVLDIVPHCGLELLHELRWGCAQLLDHLVPLVDVWCGGSGLRETHSILYATVSTQVASLSRIIVTFWIYMLKVGLMMISDQIRWREINKVSMLRRQTCGLTPI